MPLFDSANDIIEKRFCEQCGTAHPYEAFKKCRGCREIFDCWLDLNSASSLASRFCNTCTLEFFGSQAHIEKPIILAYSDKGLVYMSFKTPDLYNQALLASLPVEQNDNIRVLFNRVESICPNGKFTLVNGYLIYTLANKDTILRISVPYQCPTCNEKHFQGKVCPGCLRLMRLGSLKNQFQATLEPCTKCLNRCMK